MAQVWIDFDLYPVAYLFCDIYRHGWQFCPPFIWNIAKLRLRKSIVLNILERTESFKFLCVHISDDLAWTTTMSPLGFTSSRSESTPPQLKQERTPIPPPPSPQDNLVQHCPQPAITINISVYCIATVCSAVNTDALLHSYLEYYWWHFRF